MNVYANSSKQTILNQFNTLRPRQNDRHFPDDISKWIFLNENVWISINISLKFVPKGQINNIAALVRGELRVLDYFCYDNDLPLIIRKHRWRFVIN